MSYEPQRIVAPDGTPLVVITAADYDSLLALAQEAGNASDVEVMAARAAQEGTMPAPVLNAIMDRGISAVRAWREYRGMSQAELARKAGLSQPFINKIEAGQTYGSRSTRQALSMALNAPSWALDD